MPKAAFCAGCGRHVWLTPDGECENGHPRSQLRGIHDASELPRQPVARITPTVSGDPVAVGVAGATLAMGARADAVSSEAGERQEPPYGAAPAAPSATDAVASGPAWDGVFVRPILNTDVVWRRVVAYLIDVLIVGAADNAIAGVAYAFAGAGISAQMAAARTPADVTALTEATMGRLMPLFGALMVVLLLGEAAYYVVMEKVRGATFGKMVMGLLVRTEEGEPIGWSAAITRYIGRIADFAFLCVPMYVSITNSTKHQRIGDRLAGTIVIGR